MTDEKQETELYAVVRLRGKSKTSEKVRDTLEKLHLPRANNCTLVPANQTYIGMLRFAQNFVTWGKVNGEILAKMLEKRGFGRDGNRLDAKQAKAIAQKILKNKKLDPAEIRPIFRLSPPSQGLKSVRLQYPQGDMGARGEQINDLLLRMI